MGLMFGKFYLGRKVMEDLALVRLGEDRDDEEHPLLPEIHYVSYAPSVFSIDRRTCSARSRSAISYSALPALRTILL